MSSLIVFMYFWNRQQKPLIPKFTGMTHSEIEVKPIRTRKDYERTMKIIESLLDCPPQSKEADILEVLSILADDYENKHFLITTNSIV